MRMAGQMRRRERWSSTRTPRLATTPSGSLCWRLRRNEQSPASESPNRQPSPVLLGPPRPSPPRPSPHLLVPHPLVWTPPQVLASQPAHHKVPPLPPPVALDQCPATPLRLLSVIKAAIAAVKGWWKGSRHWKRLLASCSSDKRAPAPPKPPGACRRPSQRLPRNTSMSPSSEHHLSGTH